MKRLSVIVGSAMTARGRVPRLAFSGKWLARVGFRQGRKALVTVGPGYLVIVPKAEESTSPKWAQAYLGTIAQSLDQLRESLVVLHSQLPDPSEEMREGVEPFRLGPELKQLLVRLVEDDLDPAIDKLVRASEVTPAELREEWSQKHFDLPALRYIPLAPCPRPAIN